MLISPPFLRAKSANESDEEWIDRMMPLDSARGYPVNRNGSWHGGMHILHSDSSTAIDYVRAISDGTIISLRSPSGPDKRDLAPLNYAGGTDDGYILLKHETEIGKGENAKITYYSLYMHLKSIAADLSVGKIVDRKASLGTSGQVDGKNALHFEIFCDDANIRKIAGRNKPELSLAQHGRTDAVYGDIHFYLPTGTQFYAGIPGDTTATDTSVKHQSIVPLFVSMRFEQGNCILTTRQEGGGDTGYTEVGSPLINADGEDYEYNLFETAMKKYPQGPSAGLELLRFGRVINTDNEVLTPANAPLWLTVSYPGGTGLVNLAADEIKKFSDADFPHWTGWLLIDDDNDSKTGADSQCNSEVILCRKYDPQKVVCCFPLEWEISTVAQRYEWLRYPSFVNRQNEYLFAGASLENAGANSARNKRLGAESAVSDDYSLEFSAWPQWERAVDLADHDWQELLRHIRALCFDTSTIITGKVWRFEPRAFIKHFRKCMWMGESDLIRLTRANESHARTPVLKKSDLIQRLTSSASTNSGEVIRPENMKKYLPNMWNKYLINTPLRIAHFMGQLSRETGQFRSLVEEGGVSYFDKYEPGTDQGKKLKNVNEGDGVRFKGRGVIHLTGRYNYGEYSKFRFGSSSEFFTTEPNNILPLTDGYVGCDSAGYYWCSKQKYKYNAKRELVKVGKLSINYWADKGFTKADAEEVTGRVNPGRDGFEAVRYPAFEHAWYVLNDDTTTPSNYRKINQ